MQNFLIICVVVLGYQTFFSDSVTRANLSDEDKKLLQDTLMDVAKVCVAVENVSDEDFELLKKHIFPTSRNGMCFFRCFTENLGFTKNGKILRSEFITRGKQLIGEDPDTIELIEQGADECINEVAGESDSCEYAIKFTKCGQRVWAKWGIDITP